MSGEGDFWGIVRSAEVTSTFGWSAEEWEGLALAFADLPYDPALRRHAAKRVWRLPGVKAVQTCYVFPKIQEEDPVFVWMHDHVYLRGHWDYFERALFQNSESHGDLNPLVTLFTDHPKNVMGWPSKILLGQMLKDLGWNLQRVNHHLLLAPVLEPVSCSSQVSGGSLGMERLLRVFSFWLGVPWDQCLITPDQGLRRCPEHASESFLRMWEQT